MFNGLPVTNPAELALPFVDTINARSQWYMGEEEEKVLAELDHLTDITNMRGTYFTQAGRAFAIPISFEVNEPVTRVEFDTIKFEGRLATFSVVKIGRISGPTSVRSLCLSFDEVTLLPYFDSLPEDQLLHVPALAVDSMLLTGE